MHVEDILVYHPFGRVCMMLSASFGRVLHAEGPRVGGLVPPADRAWRGGAAQPYKNTQTETYIIYIYIYVIIYIYIYLYIHMDIHVWNSCYEC